eukprot:CAMPEP_0117030418 /NCGR_PEP_ID=MMETSP0472-20121206/21960_1 /TAXON_ID=693140 ORGANISM="Tiarina fusus, Strain LIS" /NCGR_SAMPLE_ID=MMETSP0472 /ASSEMBLY_ACC=CAM_ASM_000603 /LENGTH=151 /DNA_ID=CAMNT_0004738491 /DNA_START=49 /DNA_END=504 /DNA_ORIENTATION=-
MKITNGILEALLLLAVTVSFLVCGDSVHAFSSTARNYDRTTIRHQQVHLLYMGRPGQSEAQQRQDRENEIRSKMAKLKSAGRMNKVGDGSESMMNEAEAFFNQESPLRKLERATKARKEAAETEALLTKQQHEEDQKSKGAADDDIASTTK